MKELFLSKPLLQGRHFKIKIIAIKDTLVKSENTKKENQTPWFGPFSQVKGLLSVPLYIGLDFILILL